MQELTGGEDVVAGLFEAFGYPWDLLAGLELALGVVLGPVGVDAGGGRSQARHKTGAGRPADRCLAVRVSKEDATLGEQVHVGRRGLRVASAGEVPRFRCRVLVREAADPVVEIIDGDEQDVVARRGGMRHI